MPLIFRTNVDAAQRLVSSLEASEGMNPLIGDLITVYESPTAVIKLKVCSRTWRHDSWASGRKLDTLVLELTIPDHFTITTFTNFVRDAGLPV
jgi:hypothetical protein